MFHAWGAEAFYAAHEIENFRSSLSDSNEPISNEQRATLTSVLKRAYSLTGGLELTPAMDMVVMFQIDVENGGPISKARVMYFLDALIVSVRGQIGNRSFLYLPDQDADLYMLGLDDWGDSARCFPSAAYDMEEAQKCLALTRYTAAVFHAMRVVEPGLRAIAKALVTPLASKGHLELEEWGKIIPEIEKAIKNLNQLPKTTARQEDLRFFGHAGTQVSHFKDAYRNRVMHSNERYDDNPNRAKGIVESVKEFMRHISARLHE